MYIDAHTHLNSPQIFVEYKKYIENFKNIWGKKLVNVWVDFSWTEKALKIENEFPDICLSTWWFHPTEPIFKYNNWKYEFEKWEFVSWDKYLNLIKKYLENLCKEKKIVAIWECWTDFHYFQNIKEWQTEQDIIKKQEELLILQAELSKKYNLPLIIHSRDSFEKSYDILKNYKEQKIYFHCWWYWKNEIKKMEEKFPNIWFWFDGNITYKKVEDLRESIKQANIKNILFETDAPYLTPQIIRKEMNQPANVKYVYDFVSKLLDIPLKQLQEQIKNNFKTFYNL